VKKFEQTRFIGRVRLADFRNFKTKTMTFPRHRPSSACRHRKPRLWPPISCRVGV